MTHQKRFDPELTTADLAAINGWTSHGTTWGDLSFDQADGFAPATEPELPGPDLNDDRGYGFGV